MAALSLEEKLAGQKQIRALEVQRNAKCKSLFEAPDQVDRQRENLIANTRASSRKRPRSIRSSSSVGV